MLELSGGELGGGRFDSSFIWSLAMLGTYKVCSMVSFSLKW